MSAIDPSSNRQDGKIWEIKSPHESGASKSRLGGPAKSDKFLSEARSKSMR